MLSIHRPVLVLGLRSGGDYCTEQNVSNGRLEITYMPLFTCYTVRINSKSSIIALVVVVVVVVVVAAAALSNHYSFKIHVYNTKITWNSFND